MEKRLYRSRKDRMLFGVCGGLAEYFNIDPVIIRVIFIITIFFGGLGILAYVILAIVVPLESSQSTEPRQTIRENVEEMRQTAENVGKDIHSTFSSTEKKTETPVVREHHHSNAPLIIGLIILIVGVLALIGSVSSFYLSWRFWAIFWPIVLIIIGVLIIFARRR
jgi:phage shock protein C